MPRNSFTILRLLAAIAVVVTHAYSLLGMPEHDSLYIVTRGVTSWSRLGVWMFFVMSGYLVTQSWLRAPKLSVYVQKRALRIFPALIAVVLITVFIVGPLATVWPRNNYWHSLDTWRYLKAIFLYRLSDHLPGVFLHNPFPGAVNGSLWTLAYECTLYMVPVVLGWIGFLKRRWLVLLFWLTVVVLNFATKNWLHTHYVPVLRLSFEHLVHFAGFFLAGVVAAVWKKEWRGSWFLALVLGLIWYSSFGTFWAWVLSFVVVPYLTLFFAHQRCKLLCMVRLGDLSYGLYIYAFVVMQLLVAFVAVPWTTTTLAFATVVISLIPAFISWHCLEAPALKLKPQTT